MCNFFMILATFFGGGLISLLFQVIIHYRDSKRTQLLFLKEISNVVIYCEEILKRDQSYQWIRQSIPTSFYETNSHLLVVFEENRSEKILKFYSLLHDLRFIDDTDNKEIDRLISIGRHGGAENIKTNISLHKQQLRENIVKLGLEIVNH